MKKFLKFGAALTALVLGLACFAACSNDDGGESRSVVAEWKCEDDASTLLIFYSDGTYERKEKTIVVEKGKYYGGNPIKEGDYTIEQQMLWDDNANDLITTHKTYYATIESWKYDDDLLGTHPFLKLYIELYDIYYLEK